MIPFDASELTKISLSNLVCVYKYVKNVILKVYVSTRNQHALQRSNFYWKRTNQDMFVKLFRVCTEVNSSHTENKMQSHAGIPLDLLSFFSRLISKQEKHDA